MLTLYLQVLSPHRTGEIQDSFYFSTKATLFLQDKKNASFKMKRALFDY